MSIKAITAQAAVVGVPVGNTLTNDGIITALDLESMVWMGMTYGALFKVFMFISLVLIVLLNLNKLIKEAYKLYQRVHKVWTTGKKSVDLEELGDRREEE